MTLCPGRRMGRCRMGRRCIWRARLAPAACAAALLTTCPACAGPPYVTDDPEPTRTGGWENYVYLSGADTLGVTAGQAGVELNYGAATNLQLSLTVPEDYVSLHGLRAGAGDVDVGAKYRFLHPADESWLPDAALFPAVTLPIAARSFGTGHASLFVPVWLEKDFGKWSTFGGGGYDLNAGAGQRNNALLGWALTRSIGARWNIGIEIYHQTPTTSAATTATNIGFGAIYQVAKHWALMASGGPGLQKPQHAGNAAFYFSLQYTD